MNKYGVVFSGQGAQKPGMGKSLYETSPAAREVFDRAGDEIKYDCFEADSDRLKQTEVTQPAVYTMDMAAYAALREALGEGEDSFIEPSGIAGFSLGEYAAFTAAGAIGSFEEGLVLVKVRSLLMQAAGAGAMAACIGERDAILDLVEKTREEDVLEAVNYNSPQQTVVAGDTVAVERLAGLAAGDRGLGVKAIPLSVSGAFHSPLMRPAAEGLAEALKNFSFHDPTLPVYINVTGGLYEEYSEAAVGSANSKMRALMVCHIQSPVHWQHTIERMAASGIKTIIETGPGKTLTGLTKKIAPELVALNVEDSKSLNDTIEYIKKG